MNQHCSPKPAAAENPERELEGAFLKGRMRRIREKLLVLSGKGGVGKSTVAAPEDHLENNHMKIAVPIENGHLGAHFGHCAEFAIYDVDPETRTTRAKTIHSAPPHEPGVLPVWLHEQGVNVILTGGMGQRARQLFAEHGIQVVIGAPANPVDSVVADYLAGTLQTGANPCDH